MSGANGDNLHCLVRLHNALVGARCSMAHPRMDAHKQTWDALQGVLNAFDRETERELRISTQRYIEANAPADGSAAYADTVRRDVGKGDR